MRKRKWILVICVIFMIVLALGISGRYSSKRDAQLTITMNGEETVYLEYGHGYQEAGAQAMYTCETAPVSVPVKTDGQVNCHKLGDYLIQYTAEKDGLVRSAYRRVHVVDTKPPTITLISKEDSYTHPNDPYQEEGFLATDNYDGNITEQVVRSESDGVVTYTVSDSSGNTTTVSRTIHYFDPAPPELQLSGSDTIILAAGATYVDPGYTAYDPSDGDLTSAVTVTGEIDTSRSGIYTLHYSVSDTFGNSDCADRTVYVVHPSYVSGENTLPVEKNGKVIYLTFDDGPSKYTEELLDVLGKYGIKATFFVVNTGNIGIISRTAAEGHTVAIHTTTHRFDKIYASDAAYLSDLQTMEEIIFQYTGQRTKMFRFPGGSSNTVSRPYNRGIMSRLTKSLPEMGYQYYDWNVDSRDAGGARNAEEVYQNVINGVHKRNTSIVLQHDTCVFSVRAVERIIIWGLINGYTFLPLTYESPTCHHGVSN